ncbi:MAG: terminase large subunit [Syntrophorhabdaceae bacterium]
MKKNQKNPAKNASSKADRCTAYARAVVTGKIIAGPYVRGACQRHLNDLDHAGERGFYYDKKAAADAIAFFEEVLCLNGGQYEGKPFLLLPWQDFIVGSIFGWKRKIDGMRRFRVVFVETAKGSGKSPLCAGVGLKGLCADKEARAEVYAAATFKDQAMVLFRDAIAFYDQSPELQKRLVASGVGEKRWKLSYPNSNSFFKVISSEKKGQSGPRPHMALLDEIHEHRDGTVIEMLRAGFKFRRQPLSFMITNSGHDKTSACWEYHDMGTKISLEQLENDEFFAFICALDDEDLEDDRYLDDETTWVKVNPSLEHGIPGYDYIRGQIKEARGMPSKMATVKRLCFCIWTEAENPAISREAWMACQDKDYPVEILKGRRCWGGLDLSAVNDLTSFGLMFAPSADDPFWRLKVWFWIPGIGIRLKEEKDHVPYIAWRDAGYISAIDRKTIDYEFVVTQLAEICSEYNVQKIAFDRWKMKDFEKDRDRLGISLPEMVEFGQGYQSMSPAIKIFETKLIEGTMRHDGNPCLTWCASNVVAIEDAAENKKYDKSRSIGRIDGIIATVMSCGILEEVEEGSAYEDPNAEVMTF